MFLLKQTFKSLLSTSRSSETMNAFCLAGSDQQAQQSTHLAEGLPIVTLTFALYCLVKGGSRFYTILPSTHGVFF